MAIRAGGGTIVPLPGLTPFDTPAGWKPLVRLEIGAPTKVGSMTQVMTLPVAR